MTSRLRKNPGPSEVRGVSSRSRRGTAAVLAYSKVSQRRDRQKAACIATGGVLPQPARHRRRLVAGCCALGFILAVGPTRAPRAGALLSEGDVLVIGLNEIIVVDPDTGAQSKLGDLDSSGGGAQESILVNREGEILTGSYPTLRRWDPETGEQMRYAMPINEESFQFAPAGGDAVLHPDGSIITLSRNTVQRIRISGGTFQFQTSEFLLAEIEELSEGGLFGSSQEIEFWPRDVDVTSEGDIIVVGSFKDEATTLRIDYETGEQRALAEREGLPGTLGPTAVAVSNSDEIFVASAAVFRLEPGAKGKPGSYSQLSTGGELISAMDFEADGALLVATQGGGFGPSGMLFRADAMKNVSVLASGLPIRQILDITVIPEPKADFGAWNALGVIVVLVRRRASPRRGTARCGVDQPA